MTITKKGKEYTVKETVTAWTLSTKAGNLVIKYTVSKADCATLEELKVFVTECSEI